MSMEQNPSSPESKLPKSFEDLLPKDVKTKLDAERAADNEEFDRLDDQGIYTHEQIRQKIERDKKLGGAVLEEEGIDPPEVARAPRKKRGKAKTSAHKKPKALGPRQLNIADGDKRVEAEHAAYTDVSVDTRQSLDVFRSDGD
ncbi:MAG TPA: hypothetical protein VFW52_02490 [Candidatus Saccharimonadales bacterium]|nr:hypothetical protein [Candidatus Saccharimonadales bacterium]